MERAWNKEMVRRNPWRGKRMGNREGRSFTRPPCTTSGVTYSTNIGMASRIWTFTHVSHYNLWQLMDGIFLVYSSMIIQWKRINKNRKGNKGEQRGSWILITFSVKPSVFLTPVISTQSTGVERASSNWSLWDSGLSLQIRYCRIDSILLKAENRFVSWQTQQIFHPGYACGLKPCWY